MVSNMKKLIFGLLVFIPIISLSAYACPGGKAEGHGDRIIKKLELNDEQATQFREIMQSKRENMRAFHDQQYQDTLEKLDAVLNEEQMEEFQEMRERRMQHKQQEL